MREICKVSSKFIVSLSTETCFYEITVIVDS